MILYCYDESGVYTGPISPALSPARPFVNGQPNYMRPARATEVAPPAGGPGKAQVFDGGAWALLEDYRGQVVYDTATGMPRTLVSLGPIPEGFTYDAPPSEKYSWNGKAWSLTLEAAKAIKQAEIRDKADALLASLSTEYGAMERQTWDQQASEARSIQADPGAPAPLIRAIAQARGMDAATLANRILANETNWKALSGVVVGQRLALQDRLDAAMDVDAVRAINVSLSIQGA